MKKQLLVAGAISAISLGSLASFGAVSAQRLDADQHADKFAKRFNLNKDDVKKFMDEERQEHEKERQAEFKEALTKAVKAGKITEAQKTAIIKHQEETKSKMDEAHKIEDDTAREKAIKEIHDTNKKWADEQGINFKDLGLKRPGGHHRGGPRD